MVVTYYIRLFTNNTLFKTEKIKNSEYFCHLFPINYFFIKKFLIFNSISKNFLFSVQN